MSRVSYAVLLLGCPQECLTDRDAMIRFLEEVVPAIGMTQASAPLVVEIASQRTPFIGLSGRVGGWRGGKGSVHEESC